MLWGRGGGGGTIAPCDTRFWWGRSVCVSLLMLPKQFGFQGNGVKVRRLLPALSEGERRVSRSRPPAAAQPITAGSGGGHPGLPACSWGGAGWQSAWRASGLKEHWAAGETRGPPPPSQAQSFCAHPLPRGAAGRGSRPGGGRLSWAPLHC